MQVVERLLAVLHPDRPADRVVFGEGLERKLCVIRIVFHQEDIDAASHVIRLSARWRGNLSPERRPGGPYCIFGSLMIPAVNLGDVFDPHASAETIALIDCLDWAHPREYSHGEVDRLADACARGLLRRGLKRGDAVAILAGNRAEFVVAYFGAMRAGLVAVPVNVRFPRETMEFVLRDSAAKLVFCD